MKSQDYRGARSSYIAGGGLGGGLIKRARGFTLIELMVTIAISAILAGLAAPSFQDLIASNRLKSHASSLLSSLLLARSEAIKRNSRVVQCKSADGATCTTAGEWQQGWIIFADTNNNAAVDSDELVIHQVGALTGDFILKGKTATSPVKNYVSYSSTGETKLKASEAFQAGTFTLCQSSSSGVKSREIVISPTGRPTIRKSNPELTACQ